MKGHDQSIQRSGLLCYYNGLQEYWYQSQAWIRFQIQFGKDIGCYWAESKGRRRVPANPELACHAQEGWEALPVSCRNRVFITASNIIAKRAYFHDYLVAQPFAMQNPCSGGFQPFGQHGRCQL